MLNPNAHQLHNLIAWLETKDPEQTYDYSKVYCCLLAQYYRDMGYPAVRMLVTYFTYSKYIFFRKKENLPDGFNYIAGSCNTFGDALKCAREIARERPEYRNAI